MAPRSFGAGGLVYGDTFTLVPQTTATGNGASPTQETRNIHTLRLALAVTAATGTTPSLTVTLEHSPDGTTWVAHSAFPSVTAAGSTRRIFSGLDRFVRATWAVTGTTPSFTFTVAGEAVGDS